MAKGWSVRNASLQESQDLMQWQEVHRRRSHVIVLDRETCDWVIDDERATAICRTHGEICDGIDSPHFPGKEAV